MSFKSFEPKRPNGIAHPDFVSKTIDGIRSVAEKDGQIRIRIDSSAASVICISCTWQSSVVRDNPRRVFLYTAKTEEGHVKVTYMSKMWDEEAVTKQYQEDEQSDIHRHVLRFLRIGEAPLVLEPA